MRRDVAKLSLAASTLNCNSTRWPFTWRAAIEKYKQLLNAPSRSCLPLLLLFTQAVYLGEDARAAVELQTTCWPFSWDGIWRAVVFTFYSGLEAALEPLLNYKQLLPRAAVATLVVVSG